MLEKLRTTRKLVLVMFIMLVSAKSALFAQQGQGFFFDVGADYLTRSIARDELFGVPFLLGGHAGFGWSLKKLDLSFEIGITGSAEGKHPVFGEEVIQSNVSGLQIPLTLKGSYNVLPKSAFEIRPEAYLGVVWTDKKMIVMNPAFAGATIQMSEWELLLGTGIRFSYGFGSGLTALYLGGYFDYRFNIGDFINPNTQLANFQFRTGVLIHPLKASKKRGYSGPKKFPMSNLNAAAVTKKNQPYIANGQSANFGNIDNVLLSVLRKDMIMVDNPPAGKVDAPGMLAYMRQESTPFATPAIVEMANVTETPSLSSKVETKSVKEPKAAKEPKPEKEPKPTKEPKPAKEPKPIKEVKETKDAIESDSMKKEAVLAKADDDNAKKKAEFIKQQKQELAAMKAELKQQEALVSGDTAVTRSKSSSEKYSVSDFGSKDMDTIYYGPEEIKNPVIYSIPTLDAVGQKLQASPDLFVTIRGYSAAAGSKAGQDAVSEKRARYCAAYIINKYNIQSDRIVLEWYGAAKKPEKSLPYNEIKLNRAVELIISPLDKVAVAPKKR